MRVQVTIPVTISVDYDTDGLDAQHLKLFLTRATVEIARAALSDGDLAEYLVEAMTDETDYLVQGLSVSA
jgi:hypothetical protein